MNSSKQQFHIPFEFTPETVSDEYISFVTVRSVDGELLSEYGKNVDPEEPERRHSLIFSIAECVFVVVLAFFIAIIMNIYVFRLTIVDGTSMNPTLKSGQTLCLSRVPYVFSHPKTGDIVVLDIDFEKKRTFFGEIKEVIDDSIVSKFNGEKDSPVYYIKRVVAVAGDTVEFRDNLFYRNGEQVTENYIFEQNVYTYANGFSVTVPEGYVFVMGDNRNNSKDSRSIGLVPVDHIIGKAIGK